MRPLKLELQGFTAFREHQKITLADLDLFTITGPTGAGKSSLLDAMIYALYGKVPRVGGQGLADLVSHGLAEARISLEFAIDGTRYRVARRLRRHGASSAIFECADGDGWVSDVERSGVKAVNQRIEELVKLDFDAFTRAVVLPQGEFQRFLRGDRDERRDVLTDLLGLEFFLAMGRRARARITRLEASVSTTLKILDERYADATPQRVKETQAAHKAAQKRATARATAVATASDLDGKATGLRNGRHGLQRHADEINEVRSELREKLEACQDAHEREDNLSKAAAHAKDRCEQMRAQAAAAETRLTQLTKQHGSLEELARAEAALQTHTQCQKDLAEREKRLEKLTSELQTLETKTNAAQEKVGKLTAAAQAAKSQVQQADKATETARIAAEAAADRLAAAENAVAELREAEEEAKTWSGRLEETLKAKQDARRAAEAADKEYGDLARAEMAATLAQRLTAGDPCPVCHRVLDAAPEIEEHVAEAIAAAERRRDKTREKVDAATSAYASSKMASDAAQRRLKNAQKSVQKALTGVESTQALQEQATNAKTLAAQRYIERTAARHVGEKAAEAESVARVNAGTLATTLAAKRSARDDLDRQRRELRTRLAQAAKTLQAQFKGKLPADAAKQMENRRKAVMNAGEAGEAARKAAVEAQTDLQRATEALANLGKDLSKLEAEISRLRARCESAHRAVTEAVKTVASAGTVARLPRAVSTRETHVTDLVAWCDGAEQTLTAADGDCEKALGKLDRQLAKLATDHEVQVHDGDSPAEALKAAEEVAREARVRCEATLDQAKQRLEERDQLTESIAESQAEIQVLRILTAELRADRFVQFIIQQTLDLLAIRASEQLMRISSERYSLISHEGEFSVIDHANADEQRSVKTLSGGETFLASLSLALALSQHVGELATEGLGAKLEAVFIDEGFGQLDPETLEDVIDALERLREGNLMVGVITHVPALAERIRVGLRVEKNGNQSTVLPAAA